MNSRIKLFEESPILKGYIVAVRDDWTYKIKRIFLNKKQKEAYLKHFGEKIVTMEKFFEWLTDYQNKNK